jgi:hypothetical protein
VVNARNTGQTGGLTGHAAGPIMHPMSTTHDTTEPRLTAESIIHEWRKGRISASLWDGMLRAEGYELAKDHPADKAAR